MISDKRKFIKANDDATLPVRSTLYSAGYDFFASEDMEQKFVPNTIIMVPTGIKVKMPKDNVLIMANRSSNPKKLGLFLANGIGIIDADYPGEIMFPFYVKDTIEIKKGQRLGQGVFTNFLTVANDQPLQQERQGGFGSTGK